VAKQSLCLISLLHRVWSLSCELTVKRLKVQDRCATPVIGDDWFYTLVPLDK
jgi:hypothetical protein